MTQDREAWILYWTLVGLDSWGTALRRNNPREDWWAKLYDDPRDRKPAWCYKHVGVLYDPTGWAEIGEEPPPDQAERQSLSRALRSLEAAGAIVVDRRGNGRAGYLRPTSRGLQVAFALHPGPDRVAIRKSLETAAWATKQHVAAIDEAIKSEANKRRRATVAAAEIGEIPPLEVQPKQKRRKAKTTTAKRGSR